MTRLPGPRTPLGHLAWGLRLLRDPYDGMVALQQRYGPVSAIGYRPLRYVYALGRDANEVLLSSARGAFEWREALKALIPVDGDTALVVSDGEEHDRRRRLVMHAFALRRIHGYYPVIDAEAHALAEHVLAAGGEVDVHRAIKQTVRRIAIRTLFGDQLGTRAEAIGDALQVAIDFANRSPLFVWNIDLPLTRYRRAMQAVRVVDEIVFSEIERRRLAGAPTGDLLDHLLAASDGEGGLTDQEVRDQVVSLIAGGYETTASFVTWLLDTVLRHPAVHERLTAELDGIGELSPAALEGCTYFDAVVNETLRLRGPTPISARFAPAPVEVLGHALPARTTVVWSGWVTHREPAHWPRPERFEPERWLRGDTVDPYAFVPFGGGYRRCIGFALATLEAKTIVATLLRVATLQLRSPTPVPSGVATMSPKRAVTVVAERRYVPGRDDAVAVPAGPG